jgi:hypothetical protein
MSQRAKNLEALESLVPDSIDIVREQLDKRSYGAAMTVLDRTGYGKIQTINQNHSLAVTKEGESALLAAFSIFARFFGADVPNLQPIHQEPKELKEPAVPAKLIAPSSPKERSKRSKRSKKSDKSLTQPVPNPSYPKRKKPTLYENPEQEVDLNDSLLDDIDTLESDLTND